MEKDLNSGYNNKIVYNSRKHWILYVLPVIMILLGLFMLLIRMNSFTLLGIVLLFSSIMYILRVRSVHWIFNEEELIIKKGFLPWNKSNIEIPVEDIYEAFSSGGFWAMVFRFGDLNIRRTEGNTSGFKETVMSNHKFLIESINTKIRAIKKQKISKNDNSDKIISVSDELLKLSVLKDKGVLTEEEFLIQKQKIINNS
jgi:uncharacterized membrane protein YdbT with pleckstrin-like domain